MPIKNRDRYPNSEFVPAADIKPFVRVGGQTYVLVGYEDGDKDAPLVAQAVTNNPAQESLYATPLYELMKFSQGAVEEL